MPLSLPAPAALRRAPRSHPPASRTGPLGLVLLWAVLLASGCSMFQREPDTRGAEALYDNAKAALDAGNYGRAIQLYETLEARFPFGVFAEQAQLEVGYAYYKFGEPESAVSAADRFIRLHPRHPAVDYAYYLKGLANFSRAQRNVFASLVVRDPAKFDQAPLREAVGAFNELVGRFPESRYTPDARTRLVYLRNKLAEHELYVARYYMKRRAYVAAVNRVEYMLERYHGAPAMAEGLELMARAYEELELYDLADDTRRVLALNFPDR